MTFLKESESNSVLAEENLMRLNPLKGRRKLRSLVYKKKKGIVCKDGISLSILWLAEKEKLGGKISLCPFD